MSAIWWLFLNFLFLIILAFFSMTEMACVSFNRVRLHYYVSKGNQRAIWLNTLLNNPSMLFGTTLIGVIFGELAPMFAARHYPEHVAMLGAPILYGTARLMTPLLWVVNGISEGCHWLIGRKDKSLNIYLTEEELQHILEEQDEETPSGAQKAEFNAISTNIFRLREKTAQDVLTPLTKVGMLPSHATVGQLRNLLRNSEAEYTPIYHHHENNIIGIAHPRDLIRLEPDIPLKRYLKAPWFVTKGTHTIQILKQFRRNNQSVAIILDEQGNAIGVVDIENLLEEIFGKILPSMTSSKRHMPVIDRTLRADTTVGEFEKEHGVHLYTNTKMTLGEVVTQVLQRSPEEGDTVQLKGFELTVKATTLRDLKTIHIRSLP